jgi:mono/diheme cytochrome c family protein
MRLAVLLWMAAAGSAAAQAVDFTRDVKPILTAKCASCHGGKQPQGGLALNTPEDLRKGGVSGPAIVPGSGKESLLIQRISGFRPPVMPATGDHLSGREIEILQKWIDQGARPAANPVDALITQYFQERGIALPAAVSDAVFARRAYLDLWGLLPTPEQWSEFVNDPRSDKRERLIDALLANRRNYSEHWISFWNDLLRNDEGVVYHGARESITTWLLQALQDNMPYDRFVRALLDPRDPGDPAGFLIGVNWRGDVSASQSAPMQAAQNSAQVFLGVNLKCNSCHDSFISKWKLKDAYGLAGFFSEHELEIYRCDVKTGEKAVPKFLFPEMGGIRPDASLAERRAAAARLFTAPANRRFARTIVNRIWQRLLGRGLVEPADDMDAPAWDPDLLEWLAADFVDHGYDMQHLLRRIMTSVAYQLPSVAPPAQAGRSYTFQGPLVRRLTAEQFVDALSSLTGEWRVLQPATAGLGRYSRDWRMKSTSLTRALGRPIRDQVFTGRNNEPTTLQALELVNGEVMANLLHRGARRMLGKLPPAPANLFDSGEMRSGQAVVDVDISGAKRLWLLLEDAGSYDPARVAAGWAAAELIGPDGVTRLADLEKKPGFEKRALRFKTQEYPESLAGALPSEAVYDIAGKGYVRFRAVAGVDKSCLRSDISPRVRFFVFTEEPDRNQLVKVAGDYPVPAPRYDPDAGALIAGVYRYALGRDPRPEEAQVAREFLSPHVGPEGLEDLLWSVFLSPEFQFIR